jgi:opacity protein-like surface antigen
MNGKLHKWPSRLLLIGMGLFGPTLFAQSPGDQASTPPATQQTSDQDKKPAPAAKKEEEKHRQPDLGVAVDSARKSDVLATWITTENNEGENAGPWVIKQSAEFGGRVTDFTGNTGTWDTMVNLGTGARLMEYTLDLHSPDHKGFLFDDLNFSNFGYGGDPNNVSRVRAQKGKIYSFNSSFRRDQNIFDYNLFANPLNPATSTPNVPIINSPHEFLITRRMSDANLSLFPVGNIRFKLGWSRVVNEGSSFSSDHQGTEALLFQPTLNTTDNYNFGVSLRFIPRTNLNYDQFYTYFKGDTTANLATAAQNNIFGIPNFSLAGGIPVSLGLPFNSPAGQPCNPVILGTGFANPACNGYFSYNRFGRTRNSFPTEQFSFQSNYFRRVDMSGRLNYSDAEASNPSTAELFDGLITRNRVRNLALTGSSLAHRISLAGDFAVTFRVTDKFRIVDSFRYDGFRIPGNWSLTTANLFGATLLSNENRFTPATCPPPFTAATCPQHNASSSADLIFDARNDFLGQKRTGNTFMLEYDFTKRITAHVGYRFERKEITQRVDNSQVQTFFPGPTAALANRGACAPAVAHPLNPDGTCTVVVPAADAGEDFVQINGHTGLIGFSARPTDKFRISADAEFFTADNTFFRISPRHSQDYRFRANYKPLDWTTFGAAVRIVETRNTSLDIGGLGHNRSFGFSGVFAKPESKWGVDLSYDYNDIFSQINICFVATPNFAPPGAISCGTPFLSGLSTYTNVSHFAAGSLVMKPWKRVTAGAGYAVTSTSGNTLILNPIAPTGPLSFNYHLPTASIAFAITEKLTYKTGWNYYDYNEKSNPGPTLPRDFRGNMFAMSVRYTM